MLLQDHEDELAALKDYNDLLKQQQEIDHQNKLLEIREQFALSTKDIEAISLTDSNKEVEGLLNEKVELVEESNKKIDESNTELIKI